MEKKGLVQIITPPLPDSRKIPTEDNPQKKEHAREKFHPPYSLPILLKDKVNNADKERKDKTHWPLGQSGEGHTHVKTIKGETAEILFWMILYFPVLSIPKKKTKKRSGCEKGKRRIDIGPSGKKGKFKTGGEDETSQKACSGTIEVFPKEESDENGEGPKKGGWKSDGKRGKSLPEIRGESNEPKKEGRFV